MGSDEITHCQDLGSGHNPRVRKRNTAQPIAKLHALTGIICYRTTLL